MSSRKFSFLAPISFIYNKIADWADRFKDAPQSDETEFLPGALAVMETKPSLIGRKIIWAIILFLILAIIWAYVGKIDVVGIASGKIIPSGQIKVIQAADLGVVEEIAVKEGQHVEAGQLLVLLDTTDSGADVQDISNRLLRARCDLARLEAAQKWDITNGTLPVILFPENADQDLIQLHTNRLEYEALALIDGISSLESETTRLNARLKNSQHQVEKLKSVLDIETKRTSAVRQLYDQEVATKYNWLSEEKQRIGTQQDLASEEQQGLEVRASLQGMENDKHRVVSEFRRDILQQKSTTKSLIDALQQNLAKAEQRSKLCRIISPVSGEVQQLAVHTIGGVVTEAQPLMVVVPDQNSLEVETSILGKDIGFIHEGQKAEVKLETFPFTEYGSIPGEVISVSKGAVQGENGELTFLCRVALARNSIIVNGQEVDLCSGMKATAEIKLRKRRVISFFLSPLIKHTSESLRER